MKIEERQEANNWIGIWKDGRKIGIVHPTVLTSGDRAWVAGCKGGGVCSSKGEAIDRVVDSTLTWPPSPE